MSVLRSWRRLALQAHRLLGSATALLLGYAALSASGAPLRLALWLLLPTVLAASLGLTGGRRAAGWVLLHLQLMLTGLLCAIGAVRLSMPVLGALAVAFLLGGVAAALASGRPRAGR